MVEMLGTLAIMGVLSVVGLAIWSKVMDKHHANTILNEINKRAWACMSEVNLMDRNPCLLEEYSNKIDNTYTVSTFRLSKNSFEIQVADVPQKVCQEVLNMGHPKAAIILPETCTSTNTLRFLFDQEMAGDADKLCDSCPSRFPKCCNGICCECQTDADCTENTAFGSDYTCQSNMCINVQDWCQECIENGQFCNYNNGSSTQGVCASAAKSTLKMADGKTYYVTSLQTNWYGAKSFCAVNGMHLVPLDVLCPNNQIGERCTNYPYGGNWRWTLTSKNASMAYIIANATTQQIKDWTKTTAQAGVRPICSP